MNVIPGRKVPLLMAQVVNVHVPFEFTAECFVGLLRPRLFCLM